jgi:hypothetical protein
MSLDAKQIIPAYFYQLVSGCDSLHCETTNCKSCPRFPFNLADANAAAQQGIELSKRHSAHPSLCPGLSPLIFCPDLRNKADEFTLLVKTLDEDSGASRSKDEVLSIIAPALSNEHVFTYLLLSNNESFSFLQSCFR